MAYTPEDRDGIIITISGAMLNERGYRNWLREFLVAMASDEMVYYMRTSAPPKSEPLHVYLCIGGKIRYRCLFVRAHGPCTMTFSSGRKLDGKAWIVMAGPMSKPPRAIPMKGFQGFRYTKTLW